MFTPKAFKEERFDTTKAFIKEQPLATVVVQTQNGLEACHIPMYWQDDGSEYGCLYGHIAKVNALNDYDNLDAPWLIIFQDAGHYISPNWYPSKAITHKEVPTWNYRSVHIRGSVSLLTDPMVLTEILSELTQDFEANQPIPWSLDDAPKNYIQALCRAIVGIRISITDIQAQFKLSQNKTAENRAGVLAGLQQCNTAKADAMAKLIL
ncbi:FMN-binding negative transcriptional regulator [Psychrobacter sp. PP-21]|uniref:FMN-binding negative transcriptional regulator n=1 Tax=Psychrobacter sp. PP-21 TaxID=2957503 RepID=UPI0029A10083|nr:FMN-binding negative transcriptional regulator [Psychrobacter sp. PP-21]MDX2373728.1 FMN-binding negative transcriptional regulator [Psychrobacter sp. PP-21]